METRCPFGFSGSVWLTVATKKLAPAATIARKMPIMPHRLRRTRFVDGATRSGWASGCSSGSLRCPGAVGSGDGLVRIGLAGLSRADRCCAPAGVAIEAGGGAGGLEGSTVRREAWAGECTDRWPSPGETARSLTSASYQCISQ